MFVITMIYLLSGQYLNGARSPRFWGTRLPVNAYPRFPINASQIGPEEICFPLKHHLRSCERLNQFSISKSSRVIPFLTLTAYLIFRSKTFFRLILHHPRIASYSSCFEIPFFHPYPVRM